MSEPARIDGTPYAIPWRLTVKSLVWYRPRVFAERGWVPPETLGELEALVARIEGEEDIAPWCFAVAAGTSTGWAATDWVEDLVLKAAGRETYREWALGEIGFDDPAISSAFDAFRELVLAPGRLAGGVRGAVETAVDEAWEPLLADPPGCALYKQADFAAGWLPADTTIGPGGDVNWFPLPGEAESSRPPLLGGVDQIVQFRHTPGVDALAAYLAGPDAGTSWAAAGNFLSPKSSIPDSTYPSGYRRSLATLLGDAGGFSLDASDHMPPEVGSDLLWEEIVKWMTGAQDYDVFARRVDAALERARK